MTEKIQEFLTKYDDQHLANLQCAAEDGRLVYRDPCNCLVHHFAGTYSETKWHPEVGPLARQAEMDFFRLGGECDENGLRYPLAWAASSDDIRRPRLLEMIHAEWARRGRIAHHDWRKIGQEFNEMEELQPVSPNLR